MKRYAFDFSVVMSVYNMEKYLEEAVESVLRQTFGISRIQLILVDDGSKDNSGSICDKYQKRYPDSIEVIHKPNGGLSSARNTGLKHVRGKYVTFTDPDDFLDPDVMEKVFAFMEEKGGKADICCIPMQLFGNQTGPHLLNGKFEEGSRVIDLSESGNSRFILLHACSSFYREAAARTLEFDTVIYTAEDAKENLRLLLDNPNLGVVSDTVYHYRRHGDSIVAKSKKNRKWYTTYLNRFSKWIFDLAEEKKGYIPGFIQAAVMYDLQWKVKQQHIDPDILSPEEREKYTDLLIRTISRIDDDVICGQKQLDTERKLYLLYRKYGAVPDRCFQKTSGIDSNEAYPVTYEYLETKLDFVRFENDAVVCEGFQSEPAFGPKLKAIYGAINRKEKRILEDVPFVSDLYMTDILLFRRHYFKLRIPLSEIRGKKRITVSFVSVYENRKIVQRRVHSGIYMPVSHKLDRSWYREKDYVIRPLKQGFSVEYLPSAHLLHDTANEMAFLMQIFSYPYKGARKAVLSRLIYHLLKPFVPDDIWLVTDKADRADDNGEAFFRYLRKRGKKAGCHPVFAVRKDTPDYRRIKKTGPVVSYMSWTYKMLHLLAEHTISAYSHNEISSPFFEYSFYYGDLLQRNKIVFLQHGITKDDISNGYHRFHKNFALFMTSVRKEQESILQGNYAYSAAQVPLTGMPRYDLLYSDTKKNITIMPTWVRKLCGSYKPEDSSWELLPGFEQSGYYLFYSALLNDEKLLSTADELGYHIRFLIHPVFHRYVDRFHIDNRVEILGSDVAYRDVFAESALITTDYSSVAFDFAYLKKPVVYTQFEENHYEEGYFNYERDGFGEVEHTVSGSVSRLIEYMKNGCQLKEKYRARIDEFFYYHDKNNSERVYQAVKGLEKQELRSRK